MNHGAVIRSWRKAARKVMVCQRPCGTLALIRWPRGAQPRSGAMLVLVQVSSMNTRREGSIRSRYLVHCAAGGRHRDGPARRQSASFFVTELLGVDEFPHRAVIHLQATLGEFSHQPAQGEIRLPAPLHQPITMPSRNLLRPVAAELVWLDATGLAEAPHPIDRRTDAYAKLCRCLMARQPTFDDSSNHPLTKVVRIRSPHPCWPPSQPAC